MAIAQVAMVMGNLIGLCNSGREVIGQMFFMISSSKVLVPHLTTPNLQTYTKPVAMAR